MSDSTPRLSHWWEGFRMPNGGPDGQSAVGKPRMPSGEDLAALRKGAGRPAGSVPEMWKFYRVQDDSGSQPSHQLQAEHLALTLFGFHQQSLHTLLMHHRDLRFGSALRTLRASDRYRERTDSLDKRVAAAATADSLSELGWHLRSLVSLLKDAGLGFDYTRLTGDLTTWQRTGGPDQVRRGWGRDYFVWGKEPDEHPATSPTS
jgi:CRISPR type I-E-associated protein CasB/Cse2